MKRLELLEREQLQISCGAKPLIDINTMIDPLKIAMEEYKQKKIPIIIKRTLA